MQIQRKILAAVAAMLSLISHSQAQCTYQWNAGNTDPFPQWWFVCKLNRPAGGNCSGYACANMGVITAAHCLRDQNTGTWKQGWNVYRNYKAGGAHWGRS